MSRAGDGAMLGRVALRMLWRALRIGWLSGALVSVVWAAGPLPDVGQFGGDARSGGFAQVLEPRVFEFPRDHGPHPQYRQEWWYVTGNLDSASGGAVWV